MTDSITKKPVPRWGQERRLAFIDFRLLYDRRVNRSDLTEFFGISPNQATLDLGRYETQANSNLAYDLKERSFVPSSTFTPAYTPNDATPYLNELLAIESGIKEEGASFIGWRPDTSLVPTPTRPVGAELLAMILTATRAVTALDISYQSMSRSTPSERTISPHALGFDGHRWHVRAWCFVREGYRDFVLGRIIAARPNGRKGVTGTDDHLWQMIVPLHIGPNPSLAPEKMSAIALDYGMVNGRATLECRQPLLFYALRRLGLSDLDSEKLPHQHISLINRCEVQAAIKLGSTEGAH